MAFLVQQHRHRPIICPHRLCDISICIPIYSVINSRYTIFIFTFERYTSHYTTFRKFRFNHRDYSRELSFRNQLMIDSSTMRFSIANRDETRLTNLLIGHDKVTFFKVARFRFIRSAARRPRPIVSRPSSGNGLTMKDQLGNAISTSRSR